MELEFWKEVVYLLRSNLTEIILYIFNIIIMVFIVKNEY